MSSLTSSSSLVKLSEPEIINYDYTTIINNPNAIAEWKSNTLTLNLYWPFQWKVFIVFTIINFFAAGLAAIIKGKSERGKVKTKKEGIFSFMNSLASDECALIVLSLVLSNLFCWDKNDSLQPFFVHMSMHIIPLES